MSDSIKVNQFKFLTESPVKQGQQIEFGHIEIISTLRNIICNSDHNLTIGLFGSWGTGKSTIVETLKTELFKDKVPLILFDVWKHEGDALRRTFLKELDEQLSNDIYGEQYIQKKNILDPQVYTSSSNSNESFKILTDKLGLHLLVLTGLTLAMTIPIIALYHLFKFFFDINIFNNISLPTISTLLVSALTGGILFKYVDSFIKTQKTDVKKDRLQDPHEFEMEFDRLINNLKTDRKKIVVTFDNLDRISGDNALKIISTIKTFLDYQNPSGKTVYFLIPCDVVAMKGHISLPLGAKENGEPYVEEFLRKFFNTSIWIPEFFHTELESFAYKKLQETGIEEFQNEYLSWLIIRVFYSNPRQIVQFINLLLANYLLLKAFCQIGGLSDPNFFERNVPQLAKYLLLKQRFPEQLEQYRLTSTYNLNDTNLRNSINHTKFNELLDQTEDIQIGSLEPFFRYRISQDEQTLPGINRLLQLLLTENPDAQNVANDLKIAEQPEAFNKVVRTFMAPLNNKIQLIRFINQILLLSYRTSVTLTNGLRRDIINIITDFNQSNYIHLLKPSLISTELFLKARNFTDNEKLKILGYYIKFLRSEERTSDKGVPEYKTDDYENDLIKVLVSHVALFDQSLEQELRIYVKGRYGTTAVIKHIIAIPDLQEILLEEAGRQHILANVKPSQLTLPQTHQLFKAILYFRPIEKYQLQILQIFGSHWPSIFTGDLIERYPIESAELFEMLGNQLVLMPANADEKIDAQKASLFEAAMTLLEELPSKNWRTMMFFLWMIYDRLGSKNRIHALWSSMLAESHPTAIEIFVNSPMDINAIFKEAKLIDEFLQLFTSSDQARKQSESLLSPEIISHLVIRYLKDERLKEADNQLHQFRDLFSATDRQRIFDQLLHTINELIRQNKFSDIRDAIELLRFLEDNELTRINNSPLWSGVIGMLLNPNDHNIQENGYYLLKDFGSLLSPAKSAEVANELIEKLVESGDTQNYYVHEAILDLKIFLNTSGQEKYMRFIFDQVLIESTSTKVFIVATKALTDKYDYKLLSFMESIEMLIHQAQNVQYHDKDQFDNYAIPLREIQRLLKKQKDEKAKELLSQIVELFR